MLPFSRHAGALAESETLAITARANQLRKEGIDVAPFAVGEPDFPTPAHIVEAASAACFDPVNHRYSPTPGLPELRQAVVDKSARDSGLALTPSQVLVTNGGKHAVATAFEVLCDPGDEVLLPAPYWTTYPEAIQLAGGVPVVLPTTVADGFRVGIDQLEAALTPRTKVLVFVSPSNPTGAVYPPAEVEAIGRWALAKGLWVVTDEIYEHLTYGDAVHASMPVLVPELAERCLVLNGVAKTYAMTGWRVGWLAGPADVVTAATNLQSHTTSNVSNVAQRAAVAALEGGLDDVVRFREAFDRRRRVMHAGLAAIDGVTCLEPEGAFYAFPSFEGVLGRRIRGRTPTTTLDLCDLLLDEAKVAMVPGEAFGAPGYARLSFALADDQAAEGVRRVAALLEE